MKTTNKINLLILFVFLTACTHTVTGDMKFPEGQEQHAVYHDNIKWKPCPPHLPAGCEISILEGNPRQADLFTVRIKLSETFVMPPHTHPKDERVTILEGSVSVAFGMEAKYEDATHFKAGDYYVNARDSIHTVWADSPSIIQITGIGPWGVNFIHE